MGKRPKRKAKRKAKAKSPTALRIVILEKMLANLNRRLEHLEETLGAVREDTPDTVAEKAAQARDVMGKAADVVAG